MSWQPANDANCDLGTPCPALETTIVPRARDIGGFEVRRALPSRTRKLVGPFIFFDQMGPNSFALGQGLDVRPHPHIGLSTLTYLFEGAIDHRDSLGTFQTIRPGEVNWMTAGRGIAHSERTGPETRSQPDQPLYGIQAWIALPHDREETDPAFYHHKATALPGLEGEGKRVRLIAGSLYGQTSPVQTTSAMFYADALLEVGATLPLPAEHEERGVYLVDGAIRIGPDTFDEPQLLIFRAGDDITIRAERPARLMLLGGEPMDGPRHIWWNFVSSSKDRIEQAKADWAAKRFTAVPGDDEFIPLPDFGG